MAEPFVFHPLDPETRRDPFPLYARGRLEHPVHFHEGLPRPIYSVFRYADVQAILRDPATWSSEFPPRIFGQPDDAPPPSTRGCAAW